jgi:hypothetical protein
LASPLLYGLFHQLRGKSPVTNLQDESLFREVDEEVRQDEYKKIWDRYGTLFTGLALALVLGVAAFKGWQYYQLKQAEDASTVYFDAVAKANAGKSDDALAALAAVTHPGFAQLAKMREAAVIGEKGDVTKAVAAYDAIIADAKTDPVLADLARIRSGYLLADTAKPDELLGRLGKFDKDGMPWRNEAREIYGLSAWKTKDFAMADRYFNAIFTDKDAGAAIRQRAQVMIQLVGPELPKK